MIGDLFIYLICSYWYTSDNAEKCRHRSVQEGYYNVGENVKRENWNTGTSLKQR